MTSIPMLAPVTYKHKSSTGDLSVVDLLGKFGGYDTSTGEPIWIPLHEYAAPDEPGDLGEPLAPSIAATMPTRTSATVTVTPAPDDGTGRPPVHTWHYYRDGIEVGTSTDPDRTETFGSLPTDTPELVFRWTVRGESIAGLGASSEFIDTEWGGTPVGPPAARSGLARNALTATGVTLTWVKPANDTATKQGVFEGLSSTTPVVDNIDPAATSLNRTGQTPGSNHANVVVRGFANGQWGPASNAITYNHPAATILHDPVMGWPNNDEWNTLRNPGAAMFVRTYNHNELLADWNASGGASSGARMFGVTDGGLDGGVIDQGANGSALANSARNMLINFYEGTGSAARQNVEVRVAIGNEVDRDFTSGNLPANYIAAYAALRAVVWELLPGGARRFPKASVAVDLTQRQIRVGGSGPRFKAIARYLDVFAASVYPPGRQAFPEVVFTPYAQYVDAVFEALADWRATGSASGGSLANQLTEFDCWEFGIPIHQAYRVEGNENLQLPGLGEPKTTTRWGVRPRYVAGGRDELGNNWVGFLPYVLEQCESIGVRMRGMCYWNQMSNGEIPNRMIHDQEGRAWTAVNNSGVGGSTRANPDTERAWIEWVPGSRLPNL